MKILLADDDTSLRRVLQFKLEKQGYDVTAVDDGQAALEHLQQHRYDLLLSDIKMPRLGGLELLEQARTLQPELKVVLLTAHATVAQAVEAVKLGAFDYITKPFEDDELYVALEKALAFRRLESENRALRGRLIAGQQKNKLIGVSKPFKAMLAMVEKIAASDATVLLTGQSGTGKELVARSLHAQSRRADNEFVAINCAAIPRDLLESELFGHVKGAFTGAVRNKKGKFELADGGTLFLDEIGELAIELQARLLRALQERLIDPVGSEKTIEVDVRVIGATNADLKARVAEGRFRDDLYYRLNVIPIQIPSLAERRDDIPILATQFVKRFALKEKLSISAGLMRALTAYNWPGNVRELENLIERLVILRKGSTLTENDLPDDFGVLLSARNQSDAKDESKEHQTFHQAEENLVRQALERCGWNRTKAARQLNIKRHVLIYRMKKYGIAEPDDPNSTQKQRTVRD